MVVGRGVGVGLGGVGVGGGCSVVGVVSGVVGQEHGMSHGPGSITCSIITRVSPCRLAPWSIPCGCLHLQGLHPDDCPCPTPRASPSPGGGPALPLPLLPRRRMLLLLLLLPGLLDVCAAPCLAVTVTAPERLCVGLGVGVGHEGPVGVDEPLPFLSLVADQCGDAAVAQNQTSDDPHNLKRQRGGVPSGVNTSARSARSANGRGVHGCTGGCGWRHARAPPAGCTVAWHALGCTVAWWRRARRPPRRRQRNSQHTTATTHHYGPP